MSAAVRRGFHAPYATPERRAAIGDFVEDIPVSSSHPSYATLTAVAEGIRELDVPTLLMWGPGDPVFRDRYLADLRTRLPHAQVHRYEGARHLVMEDAPGLVDDFWMWVGDLDSPASPVSAESHEHPHQAVPDRPLWAALDERATHTPDADAVVEPLQGGWRRVSWELLQRQVD
jgi:hypothetical protein